MLRAFQLITNNTINLLPVLLLLIVSSCTSIKKTNHSFILSATEAKEDLRLLKRVLEAKHPALYRYQSPENFEQHFQNTINGISDSIHQLQLRNKVGYLLAPIGCGHTSVRYSKQLATHLINQPLPQFPFYLKTWKDSLVVLANTNLADSIIKRGTIITHINQIPAATIIDSMFKLISTDGYAQNFKSQVISTNFPYWYRMAWGTDSIYQITFINHLGSTQQTLVKAFSVQKKQDTLTKKQLSDSVVTKTKAPKPIIIPPQSLQLDTINKWGYLKISSFSSKGLRKFIKRSFKTIEQYAVKHLIIDIRENGGGKLQLSTLLTRFVKNRPFTIADTVAAKDRSLAYGKHLKGLFAYWFPMQLTRKQKDGLFHFKYLENKEYHPKNKYHYNGNIYILQGGYTFSAATQFLHQLHQQENVITIGEETGGGWYGNNAVYTPTLVLPNSGLRVSIPLFSMVYKANKTTAGGGISPEILVEPSSFFIKTGVDGKLQKAISFIEMKENLPKKE